MCWGFEWLCVNLLARRSMESWIDISMMMIVIERMHMLFYPWVTIQKMGLISQKFREVLFAHEESSQVGLGWLLARVHLLDWSARVQGCKQLSNEVEISIFSHVITFTKIYSSCKSTTSWCSELTNCASLWLLIRWVREYCKEEKKRHESRQYSCSWCVACVVHTIIGCFLL